MHTSHVTRHTHTRLLLHPLARTRTPTLPQLSPCTMYRISRFAKAALCALDACRCATARTAIMAPLRSEEGGPLHPAPLLAPFFLLFLFCIFAFLSFLVSNSGAHVNAGLLLPPPSPRRVFSEAFSISRTHTHTQMDDVRTGTAPSFSLFSSMGRRGKWARKQTGADTGRDAGLGLEEQLRAVPLLILPSSLNSLPPRAPSSSQWPSKDFAEGVCVCVCLCA